MNRRTNMKCIPSEKLRRDHEPVAILWSNIKPEGALQIKPHGQSCIMPFFAQVAMKGNYWGNGTI